jgi:hypothetical protein
MLMAISLVEKPKNESGIEKDCFRNVKMLIFLIEIGIRI